MTKLFGPRHIAVIGSDYAALASAIYLKLDGHQVTLFMQEEQKYNQQNLMPGIMAPLHTSLFVMINGVLKNILKAARKNPEFWALKWSYILKNIDIVLRMYQNNKKSKLLSQLKDLHLLYGRSNEVYKELLGDQEAQKCFLECGGFVFLDKNIDPDKSREYRKFIGDYGIQHELLDQATISDFDPSLPKDFGDILYLPGISLIPNQNILLSKLYNQLLKVGGVVEQVGIKSFVYDGLGPTEIITENSRYPVDAVVLAAGADSKRLLKELDYKLPLATNRLYHINFYDPGFTIRLPVFFPEDELWIMPTDTGIKCIGAREWWMKDDLRPHFNRTNWLKQKILNKFPAANLSNYDEIVIKHASWPDFLPLISSSSLHRNVFFSIGYDHADIGLAGIAGQLLKNLVSDNDPGVDINDYSIGRFDS